MAFDWTKIEGYREDMTAEEKLALLDNDPAPDPTPAPKPDPPPAPPPPPSYFLDAYDVILVSQESRGL